jgi:hypothetical protein
VENNLEETTQVDIQFSWKKENVRSVVESFIPTTIQSLKRKDFILKILTDDK